MKFDNKNIEQLTIILHNIYTLAVKKKLKNVPETFKEFVLQNIKSGRCPSKCLHYSESFSLDSDKT